MDFFTTHDAPVSVTIDGTAYSVPRFLNPALKEWSAIVRKQTADEAVEHFKDDDARARFKMYWPAPVLDIGDLLRRATTPDGADYIVDAQLKLAGVPDDVRRKVLDKSDPSMIRALAEELTMAGQTLARLGATDAEKTDPLPSAPVASAGSPATGPATSPDSAQSTAA